MEPDVHLEIQRATPRRLARSGLAVAGSSRSSRSRGYHDPFSRTRAARSLEPPRPAGALVYFGPSTTSQRGARARARRRGRRADAVPSWVGSRLTDTGATTSVSGIPIERRYRMLEARAGNAPGVFVATTTTPFTSTTGPPPLRRGFVRRGVAVARTMHVTSGHAGTEQAAVGKAEPLTGSDVSSHRLPHSGPRSRTSPRSRRGNVPRPRVGRAPRLSRRCRRCAKCPS